MGTPSILSDMAKAAESCRIARQQRRDAVNRLTKRIAQEGRVGTCVRIESRDYVILNIIWVGKDQNGNELRTKPAKILAQETGDFNQWLENGSMRAEDTRRLVGFAELHGSHAAVNGTPFMGKPYRGDVDEIREAFDVLGPEDIPPYEFEEPSERDYEFFTENAEKIIKAFKEKYIETLTALNDDISRLDVLSKIA